MLARVVFCSIISYVAVFAQSDRGTITGTITDQGGAVVPHAAVVAVNSENGTQFSVATTDTGNYTTWIMHTISAPSAGFAQLMPPVFE